MAAQRHTILLTASVVALSTATAYGLTRVFAGAWWLLAFVVAGGVVSAVVAAGTVRRWKAPLTIATVVAASIWWIVAVTNPHELFFGLPTPQGVGDFIRAFGEMGAILRSAVIPVAAVGPALQLALIATCVTTAGSAWSAQRSDGALSAVLPHLALFIALAAIGKHAYVATTVVWSLAAATFLLVHHLVFATQARATFRTSRPHRSRLAVGGAIGALVAITIGVAVGPKLPSASSTPLLKYRHLASNDDSGTITAVSPLVSIKDQLNERDPVELFTVRASESARWRLVALDHFDNNQWGLGDDTTTVDSLDDGGVGQRALVLRLTQEYELGAFSGKFLPAAYRARSVSGLSDVVFINDSATFVVNDENHVGTKYSVISELIGANPDSLRSAPFSDPETPELQKDLELPDGISRRITRLAERITADERSPYGKALALQNYLRNNFAYDTKVDLSESNDAMVAFLFDVQRGFCQQFAGTFGVMARHLGLPTRIAVGFQAGTRVGDHYSVTTKEAHAWPEVYFEGFGWIAFEPTPGIGAQGAPGNPSGTNDLGSVPGDEPPGSTTTTAPGPTTTTKASPTATTRPRFPNERVETSGSDANANDASAGRRAAVVAGGIAAVGLLGIVGWRVQRSLQRRRRRSNGTPRDRVTNAWTHVNERLALVGIHRRPSTTAVDFALREAPAAGVGAAGPALLDLARLHTSAMYAAEEPPEDDAVAAWDCAEQIDEALRATLSQRRRGWMLRLRW